MAVHTSPRAKSPARQVHLRRQGYEASKVDSLKPCKYISLGALRAQIPTPASVQEVSITMQGRCRQPSSSKVRALHDAPDLAELRPLRKLTLSRRSHVGAAGSNLPDLISPGANRLRRSSRRRRSSSTRAPASSSAAPA